jgi:cation transport ATPase
VGFTRRAIELAVPIAAVIVAGAAYATSRDAWPEVWPDIVIAACAGAYALAAVTAASAAALAHAHGHLSALGRGIVYKDAATFDVAARADVAVICSRGTVVLGEPEIVTVEAIGDTTAEHVLSLAAGTEMAASSAASTAILGEAHARGVRPEHVRSAIVHEGLGVTALAPNGDKVIVGSRGLLLKEKVSVAIFDARVSELEAEGRNVMLVALGDRSIGLLALQDGLRRGARAAIQRLHDACIEPVLLSSEARETCETIARALDIEHVRPEILPADRGAEVRALADGGRLVAAIGHASSDSSALGSADVPVAMGQAEPLPGDWGVALASDDVRDAALSLTVPRACRERARVVTLVGAGAQALSLFGIVFGIAPPLVAPVVSVIAAVVVVAWVRDPMHLPAPSPPSE